MKSTPFAAKRLDMLVLTILLALFSCQQALDDEDLPVDSAFILSTDASIQNSTDLENIQNVLSSIQSADRLWASSAERGVPVRLSEAISKLFDPQSQPCPLPSKVAKKLRKLQDDKKGWAPSYVKNHLDRMPDSALMFTGAGITALLHSVKIRKPNGEVRDWLVLGSPTYDNLQVEDFVLGSHDSFVYTLDCAGYLNAAIAAAAVVPGADIKANAKTSLEQQNSMFIGGGILISPLYGALYGEAVGVSMDTVQRIKVLNALVNIPGLSTNDTIDTSLSFQVIWASKEGNASFNGGAEFEGKGGLGIGVAQVSSSAQSGASVSRSGSFSRFDTFVTSSQILPVPEKITVGRVRALIQQLSQRPVIAGLASNATR